MQEELQHGINAYQVEQLKQYLDPIADADAELLTLQMDYMQACKDPRGRIRDVMRQAKSDGMNIKALRQIVADERAERRRQSKIDQFEADDLSDYQSMREALGEFGDTPLGAAALQRVQREEELNSLQQHGA